MALHGLGEIVSNDAMYLYLNWQVSDLCVGAEWKLSGTERDYVRCIVDYVRCNWDLIDDITWWYQLIES